VPIDYGKTMFVHFTYCSNMKTFPDANQFYRRNRGNIINYRRYPPNWLNDIILIYPSSISSETNK
ncbi:unnamed protein product, partial [Rotaria sordida]